MATIRHLALVRDTKRVDASDLTRTAAALQSQVLEDFVPAWRRSATVDAFLRLEDVPLGHWPMIVRDDISYDAQGIHLDNKYGPYSLVKWDAGWSLTASHECLEMLGDPYGSRTRAGASPKSGQGQAKFLVEVCDPCEAEQFAYKKNGVVVSDFYLPNYFDAKKTAGRTYSFTGALTSPRSILEGGYLSWKAADGTWWQQTWFGGTQPKFVDLGAKPGDVNARSFIDMKTNIPAKFMRPATRRRGVTAAAVDAAGDASTADRTAAMRDHIRELAGVG